jgi:Kae1-associated kinase Bud32
MRVALPFSMKEIARGAEAIIYMDGEKIRKVRPKKSYRIGEIDQELRKRRTKQEALLLEKLEKLKISAPKLMEKTDDGIVMEYVPGVQVKEVLDSQVDLCQEIGKIIGRMHGQGIIHGDLTTSNMIFTPQGEIVLIDFGLAYHSKRIEDQAVDLHLFLQALESRHYQVKDEAFKQFLVGYHTNPEWEKVVSQLKNVEQRGRYKMKRGG